MKDISAPTVSELVPGEPEAVGKVVYRSGEGIATITLNRPEALNPLDHGPGSMHEDILTCLRRAHADDDVRVVVVTGAGRAFCAGGDMGRGITDGSDTSLAGSPDWLRFHDTQDGENEEIRRLSKPVIGALNGYCYGAGFMMAMHFDLLVAAESASLGLIETRFGSVGAETLAFHVGPQWAKFLAISGEVVPASVAERIGLVLASFPDEEFPVKIVELARRIAAMPPTAVQLNRRLVNAAMDTMGWTNLKQASRAVNAITDSVMKEQRAADGRLFSELLDTGWSEFKAARDAPFEPAWLATYAAGESE